MAADPNTLKADVREVLQQLARRERLTGIDPMRASNWNEALDKIVGLADGLLAVERASHDAEMKPLAAIKASLVGEAPTILACIDTAYSHNDHTNEERELYALQRLVEHWLRLIERSEADDA